MKNILSALCLLSAFAAISQPRTKGLFVKNPEDSFKECCVYVPLTGLIAYESPNGGPIGKVIRGEKDQNGEVYEMFIETEGRLEQIRAPYLEMVGYEITTLRFVDRQNGFVQTYGDFWIEIEELESKGLLAQDWMQHLIGTKDVLGYYANEPGLTLWDAPSSSATKLLTLKGDLFQITPTDETDGNWCKVNVTEYSEHPCSGRPDMEIIINRYFGWIKLLSEDQTPNVWSYKKGC